MAERGEWSELDRISVDLQKSLNISNLRPFLRSKHLLTEAELEQVEISPVNPRGQAIDKFVSFLKTKGPNHAEIFLEVLKMSLKEDDIHLGHESLCETLEAVMEEKTVESLRQTVQHMPVPVNRGHRPAGPVDSGIGHTGSGSSPETSSLGSSVSESNIGVVRSMHDDHPQRSIPNRGLENLESEQRLSLSLDERQLSLLKYKITRDNENITSRFACMVLALYRLLKQKNALVDEVRLMLQYLGCHPGKQSYSSTKLFSEPDGFSESKDLLTLIECLRKYSSWYNYRLMKEVAVQFGGKEGKELISEYEDDLRKHYVDLIAYQCPEFSLAKGLPPGYTRLTVKVDWDYMSTNLQHITVFQSNLADILGLEPYVFQLQSVEEGCVCLSLALPAALESYVTSMMTEKEECLRELKVLSLEITKRIVIDAHTQHDPLTTSVGGCPSGLYTHTCIEGWPKSAGGVSEDYSKKKTLSTSSSIASLLEGPMSSTEAELLSIYSGSTVDRQSMVSMLSVGTPIAEEPSASLPRTNESDKVPSGRILITDSECTTVAPTVTQMNRTYCSEGDLLSTKSPAGMLSKKERSSLPDIARHCVTATPRCQRNDGVIRCLIKIPRSILNRFRHRQNNRERNSELPTPYSPVLHSPPKSHPFQLLELTDEPRKLTESGKKALVASYNYSLPPVQSEGKGTSPNPVSKNDQELPKSVKLGSLMIASTQNAVRDSALRESGIDSPTSTLSSQYSTQVYRTPCTRQTSNESADTMSVDSSSYHSYLSTKRGSYTSHNYVTLDTPIYEDPADDASRPEECIDSAFSSMREKDELLPRYQPHTTDHSPARSDNDEHRNRSHSHGDVYYHRGTAQRVPSFSRSLMSSGYSSYASSIVRVDAANHSQESLQKMSPSHVPHTGPFAARPPHPGNVKRGGSLKATTHYSTSRYPARLPVQY